MIALHPLLRTKLHLVLLDGEVVDEGDAVIFRTHRAPGYYHGTGLVLKHPPSTFREAEVRHRAAFGDDAAHRLILWGGRAAPSVLEDAADAGFAPDTTSCMSVEGASGFAVPPHRAPCTVRPLRRDERDVSDALNAQSDGAETEAGSASYRQFKRDIRALQRGWIDGGGATWWGAFQDGQLVGQCGMARCAGERCSDVLGRYQAVEVHPHFRRQGIGATLVGAVGRDALTRLGCDRVLLEADPEGPAVGMYERLGFRRQTDVHALLWSRGEMLIRPETFADFADIRALQTAAFGRVDEAQLVEQLRKESGTIGLVAERDGRLLGHIQFSRVRVQVGDATWEAMALAPLGVRPQAQRSGVGSALTRAGLDACRAAGHDVVFVLGSSEYYARFGFQSAPPLGLTCRWDVPAEVFQVQELAPGTLAGRRGRVRYAAPFEQLPE